MNDFHKEYIAGIDAAIREGSVVPTHPDGILSPDYWDSYSHIPSPDFSLTEYNTRPLDSIARATIESLRSVEGMHFLELGAGAGAAVTQLRQAVPSARIETIAKTPIHPFYGLTVDGTKNVLDRVVQPDETIIGGHYRFRKMSSPIVDRQYIGNFARADMARLPHHEATMVYDHFGAYYYEWGKRSLKKVLAMMRPDGLFLLVRTLSRKRGQYIVDEKLLRKRGCVVMDGAGQERHVRLIVGPDHEFASVKKKERKHLGRFLKERQQRSIFPAS